MQTQTHDVISLKGARLHNLKNLSLDIPRYQFVVLTGLSGSGKSTLAFDILHKEGQRQYLESLGFATDGLTHLDYDSLTGLSPTISVDQHLTNRSPRSTVGTATEVYTYLRVLFARIGYRPCPKCQAEIPPYHHLENGNGNGNGYDDDSETDESFPCPHCGTPIPYLGMAHFSFNKPAGACPTCTGIGSVYDANLNLLIDSTRSIQDNGVIRWDIHEINRYSQTLEKAAEHYGFSFDPALPIQHFSPDQRNLLLYGVAHLSEQTGIPAPETAAKGRFEGVFPNLLRRYQEGNAAYREKMDKLLIKKTCPDCHGTRLRPESRSVTVAGESIIALSKLPLIRLSTWLNELPEHTSTDEIAVIEPILAALHERVRRLVDVGVGYLSMGQASPTLSGGEEQRIRMASLLGSGLTGVLYVLDEPTTGLHQRDTNRLIKVLRRLRDLGNTVLVVEHDMEVIRAADYVIDMGPGAGINGGQIIAAGTPDELAHHPDSITGHYLQTAISPAPITPPRIPNGKSLTIRGARQHNLKNITVDIPLGVLTAITGVSGSGKSSLMFDIFDRAAQRHFHQRGDLPGDHDSIEGWQHLNEVITISQTPIGRTPRSNAATYTDVFTAIRQVLASLPDARNAGLKAKHFSFNVPGGRCERCQGAGSLTLNMHFLPDVEVRCPTCRGKRFKKEILDIPYRGHHVADILNMTVEEALDLFADESAVANRLTLMCDVGLGYLPLGQPGTTLSGGEAQRIKLAKELGRRTTGRTLYLLDEPTTGLHADDTGRLLSVLQRLVESGNSVVVIEHNLDIIRAADWVIDLGPEGGEAGGHLIAAGTPAHIATIPDSITGQFIHRALMQ